MTSAREVKTKLQKLIKRYAERTGASNVIEAIAMMGQAVGELRDDTSTAHLFYIGTYQGAPVVTSVSLFDSRIRLYIHSLSKVYYWRRSVVPDLT